MILKISLISLFITSLAFAYNPTIESLFRNGNNIEVGNNTIIANLKLSKKNSVPVDTTNSEAMLSTSFPEHMLKFYISNENSSEPKLVQLSFNSLQVRNDDITSVVYRPNFEYGKLGISQEDITGKFFYAVVSSILNNDGKMLVQFLQDQGVPVKLNTELINKEKLNLLRRYSEYLKYKENDENLRSPLVSEDPEKQTEINNIMESPFYMKSPFVHKLRDGENFYWLIKTSNFEAKVDDENRHIKYLKFNGPQGEIKFLFDSYLISGSNFEAPKKITLIDSNKEAYEFEVVRIQVVDEKGSSFNDRFKKFLESKNKNNLPRLPKPPFLF